MYNIYNNTPWISRTRNKWNISRLYGKVVHLCGREENCQLCGSRLHQTYSFNFKFVDEFFQVWPLICVAFNVCGVKFHSTDEARLSIPIVQASNRSQVVGLDCWLFFCLLQMVPPVTDPAVFHECLFQSQLYTDGHTLS